MEKLNLKIKVKGQREWDEARDLLNSLGNVKNYEIYMDDAYTKRDYKLVTFDELRELTRQKEYLNSEFELVVTNQLDDGWILVPDGAAFLVEFKGSKQHFYKSSGRDEYLDIFNHRSKPKNWSDTRYLNLKDIMLSPEFEKILWQREDKVESKPESKGREGNVGRFLHQWAYEAFGRGEDLLYSPIGLNNWYDLYTNNELDIFDNSNLTFRLKPQTIQIGSRTINKPISVKPEIGDIVYVANLTDIDLVTEQKWKNTALHIHFFDLGLLHKSKEDALNHSMALIETMK